MNAKYFIENGLWKGLSGPGFYRFCQPLTNLLTLRRKIAKYFIMKHLHKPLAHIILPFNMPEPV